MLPLHHRVLLRSHPAWPSPGYQLVVSTDRTCAGFVKNSGYPLQGVAPAERLAQAVRTALDAASKSEPDARLRLAVEAGQAAMVALREGADRELDDTWDFGGSLALALTSERGLHWAAVGEISVYLLQDDDSLSLIKPADTLFHALVAQGQTPPQESRNIITRYLGGEHEYAQAAYGVTPIGTLCFAAADMDTPSVVRSFGLASDDGSAAVGGALGGVLMATRGLVDTDHGKGMVVAAGNNPSPASGTPHRGCCASTPCPTATPSGTRAAPTTRSSRAAVLAEVRTVHWFDPCALLDHDARSELKPECRRRMRGGVFEPVG